MTVEAGIHYLHWSVINQIHVSFPLMCTLKKMTGHACHNDTCRDPCAFETTDEEDEPDPTEEEEVQRASWFKALGEAAAPTSVDDVFVVIDTETASLKGPVVQVGLVAARISSGGEPFARYTCLWKYREVAGHKWDKRAEGIHGISKDTLEDRGVSVRHGVEALREILDGVRNSDVTLVAHNYSFDARMLNTTAIINKLPPLLKSERSFCTMQASRRAFGKRLRNEDLYEKLIGEKHTLGITHDALVDAEITAASYAAGITSRDFACGGEAP